MDTPIYIIEETLLRRNLKLIASVAAKADIEIILAFKAFALWKTFPIFREYIHATTASSLSEARMAFEKFGAPAHTYSPAYTDDEFDEIVSCSSHLTFNSLTQYERFHQRAKTVSIGLRVNPEYSEVGTLLYNPCAPGTRFGVTADKLPEQLPADMEGFHCHCHCESGADVFQRTLTHIEEKFSRWFPQLKWINFGGGHLMTRKDYDVDLLISMMQDFHTRYPWLKVILEPGTAFAWQTGPLIANCEFTYRLGGNSCLSGDFMGSWRFPKELQVGDEVIFEDMIHYTTVKTNTFNGISHPAIGILHEDGHLEVLRRFGYEDYLNRMD